MHFHQNLTPKNASQNNVSVVAYVALTSRLRRAYVHAYVHAYVALSGGPQSHVPAKDGHLYPVLGNGHAG